MLREIRTRAPSREDRTGTCHSRTKAETKVSKLQEIRATNSVRLTNRILKNNLRNPFKIRMQDNETSEEVRGTLTRILRLQRFKTRLFRSSP